MATAAPRAQIGNGNANPNGFAAGLFSPAVLFAASDGFGSPRTGMELWTTGGTSATTRLILDIRPGDDGSYPRHLTTNVLGLGPVYFTADDGVAGRELWVSDGTAAGTALVRDIGPGARGSAPEQLTLLGATLLFSADDAASGRELWSSDGTAQGTVLVKDLAPGQPGSSPHELAVLGSRLLFVADDGASGAELWISDGTAAGTMLLLDIRPGPAGSSPSGLAPLGGKALFAADDGARGRELWATDGTAAGTVLVADLAPIGSSAPDQITVTSQRWLFTANDGVAGRELWSSNGTAGGTGMVADLRLGSRGSAIAELSAGAFEVWFRADDGLSGSELWRSDGTSTGTTRLDLELGPLGSEPRQLLPLGPGKLLCSARTLAEGHELWCSDGTAAGTAIVRSIRPGPLDARPAHLFRSGLAGLTLLAAEDSGNGIELWRTDGTAAGTLLVHDINTTAPLQPEYHVSATTIAGQTTLRFSYGAGAPLTPMATVVSLSSSAPFLFPGVNGPIRIAFPAAVVLPAVVLDVLGSGFLSVAVPGDHLGVTSLASQSFDLVPGLAVSVSPSDSASFAFGGCQAGANERIYCNGGSYNDETWEYEIPVTTTNPSGAQGYLGLIHMQWDSGSNAYAEQLVRTWPFEPSSEGGTMTVRGIYMITPEQKSRGDLLQLRYYSDQPASAAGGCIVFQTYC